MTEAQGTTLIALTTTIRDYVGLLRPTMMTTNTLLFVALAVLVVLTILSIARLVRR